MRKEVILIMDYRYDEGVRPRKEMICPYITTNTREGGELHTEQHATNCRKMDKIRIKDNTKLGYKDFIVGS